MRGSVSGAVVYAGSWDPVPRAMVVASETPRRRWAAEVETVSPIAAESDSLGAFVLEELPEGPWLLRAESEGGTRLGEASVYVFDNAVSDVTIEVRERPSAVTQRPMETPVMSEPRATGGVRGRVVHAVDGSPIEDATITVVRGAGPAPDIAPLTDSAGRFSFDGLPPGQWVLGALAPDGTGAQAAVRVAAGSLVEVIIEV